MSLFEIIWFNMNNGNQILETDNHPGETVALWADLFAIFLSLLVSYNERARKADTDSFFDKHIEHRIILLSKIILFLVITYFLYIAYVNYRDRDEFNNVENKYLLIQLISASLVFVASLLTLYVVLSNGKFEEALYENPEI